MRYQMPLRAAAFLFVIALIAVLAWITWSEPEDPCAGQQADISAAILADTGGDQDALANRAIILRGKCKKPADNN